MENDDRNGNRVDFIVLDGNASREDVERAVEGFLTSMGGRCDYRLVMRRAMFDSVADAKTYLKEQYKPLSWMKKSARNCNGLQSVRVGDSLLVRVVWHL